jgi:hypothetical protein
MTKERLCLTLFIVSTAVGLSQSRSDGGLLPSVNLIHKSKGYAYNFRIESRQFVFNDPPSERSTFTYDYGLTDISGLVSKKVDFDKAVALGYLFRWNGNAIEHRFIQQFIVTRKYTDFKLAHRITTDQTFSQIEAPIYRLRYRVATEFPLSGDNVDVNEFYFKLNHEYLNAVQGSQYDLEIRILPFIGYEIAAGSNIEIGIDYRVNSFLAKETEHRFFLGINWFKVL